LSYECFFSPPNQLFRPNQTLKAGDGQYSSGIAVDFGSANVNNKSTRQNKWFGSANKKAIFGPYFTEFYHA
jgi:hypothetical protein